MIGNTIHYPDLYTVCYGTHTVHRRLRTQKAYTVKAGYNEPNVPAIFVRYRMSSLYNAYNI